jgi:hypothetical protein
MFKNVTFHEILGLKQRTKLGLWPFFCKKIAQKISFFAIFGLRGQGRAGDSAIRVSDGLLQSLLIRSPTTWRKYQGYKIAMAVSPEPGNSICAALNEGGPNLTFAPDEKPTPSAGINPVQFFVMVPLLSSS